MTITRPDRQESQEFAAEQLSPGLNSREIQAKVPFAVSSLTSVPKQRFYDRGFFEEEKEHLWPHSWLMAARLEEIPNPGDYSEFEVVGNSILVIRQADGSVKALHNACRHRATELAKGCGRLPGGQLVCPFHGWRWNLDGSSSYVFMDGSFDPATMRAEDLRLRECLVEVWAGMVWINMDRSAPPLSEALSPVMRLLDGVGVGNMRAKWWKQVILKSNWKMAMEAFLETYHVMQTHPQLMMGRDSEWDGSAPKRTGYTSFRGGHGRFEPSRDLVKKEELDSDWNGDDFIESNRLLASGQDAMALDRDVAVFESIRNRVGVDSPQFAEEAIKALYEHAAGAGIPMEPPGPNLALWGGEIFLFPNYFMLPMYGNCLAYRMRPYNDDPEQVVFDVWSLTTYPEGHDPGRLELLGVFDTDDSEHWGLIPRQDFSNIERQQRGLHSQSFESLRLSPSLETNIVNYQLELDRVIAKGKS